MSDETPASPTNESRRAATELPKVNDPHARCAKCGYQLNGLPLYGMCPECGSAYSPDSMHTITPWPSPLVVCWRIGWPLASWAVIAAFVGLVTSGDAEAISLAMFCAGWPLLIVAVINGYFQVRSMLKKHMPEEVRTRGPVAVMRAIGTTLCIILLLILVAPPVACAALCVTMAF